MAYLGKTPSQATRKRYYKTASGSETSISGTMTVGGTLTFTDGEFVDVSVNGVALVAGTDYNTTTANTIGGLSALSANDQVEIVVYDTFSVFGGNVNGDFTVSNGTLTAGTVDINGGAVDGTTIGAASASTGAFTTISASGNVDFNGDLDVDGTTNLDVVDIDGAVDMASTLQVDGAITSSTGLTVLNTGAVATLRLEGDVGTAPHAEVQFAHENYTTGYGASIGTFDAGSFGGGLVFKTLASGSASSTPSEVMRLTNAGRLGLGVSSPSATLDVNGAVFISPDTAGKNTFRLTSNAANDANLIMKSDTTDKVQIQANGTSYFNGGNVGIGINSPQELLHINDSSSPAIRLTNSTTGTGSGDGSEIMIADSDSNLRIINHENSNIRFETNGSERMRLDSSGNLLVGKTSSGIGTEGIELRANDDVMITQDGDVCLYLNRLSSDGDLIDLRKAGTTFCSIGVMNGDNPYIANDADNSGLQFGSGSIVPSFDGAGQDNSVDLGSSSTRFKHGYFANTVYTASVAGIADNDTYINFANNNIMQFLTGGSERARFDASGNFLVGQSSQSVPGLSNTTVGHSIRPNGDIFSSCNAGEALYLNRSTNDGGIVSIRREGTQVGVISVTTSGTTYSTTSDRRLKQDIEPLAATDKLMAMNPVSYAWKADPSGPRSMGFIAQEMQEIMPDAVTTGNDEDSMMSMDYGRITPILVSALQDAHRKIEQLETRIAALEAS